MGKGRFIGTGLDLYVSFDFNAAGQETEIEEIFANVSQRFYQSTDGQLRIDNIYWVDEALGRNIADSFCRQVSGGGVLGRALLKGLGIYGAWMEVYDFDGFATGIPGSDLAKRDELASVFIHEVGHYAWGLGDEYAGPTLTGPLLQEAQETYDANPPVGQEGPEYQSLFLSPEFDTTNPNADGINLDVAPYYDVSSGSAFIFQDGTWHDRIIIGANFPGDGSIVLTLNPPGFDVPPSETEIPPGEMERVVRVRPFGICNYKDASDNIQNSNCIMGARGAELGRTEFCGSANHDHNQDTAQSNYHPGESCLETIEDAMNTLWEGGFQAATQGDPGTGDAPAVSVTKLAKEHRFVLVLDRSGSMAEDDKIEGARGGLEYWIDFAALEDDYMGIVWFNHGIVEALPLQKVDDISDIDGVKDEVLDLAPEGATNIKDALLTAAQMLVEEAQDRGPAYAQYILLMTDGVHNTPPPSSLALDAVDICQENGIQIFTLGLGTAPVTNEEGEIIQSGNIDQGVLEGLADRTSGKSIADALDQTGANQAGAVGIQLSQLRQELRGERVASIELPLNELSSKTKFDAQMIEWSNADKKPLFKDLLKAAEVENLSDLLPQTGRFNSTSFWVEEGVETASVVIHFPKKQPVWLYVFDPEGHEFEEVDGRRIKGRYPYEAGFIKEPKPGRWTVLVARREPGPAMTVPFSAGVENRAIVVAGDSDKVVALGSSARIWARAFWDDELSGLQVTARIRDPQGGSHTVKLSDETADDPMSGSYQGWFTPSHGGRHEGEIRIAGKEEVLLGGGIDRLNHMKGDPKKGRKLDLKLKRGRFQRIIPFYFDAGTRIAPRDRERALGLVAKSRTRARRSGKDGRDKERRAGI